MKLKAQLVKREIAGDTILVPVGETTTKLQGLLTVCECAPRHRGRAAGGRE